MSACFTIKLSTASDVILLILNVYTLHTIWKNCNFLACSVVTQDVWYGIFAVIAGCHGGSFVPSLATNLKKTEFKMHQCFHCQILANVENIWNIWNV